jgi:hypothetical protein
MPRRRRELVLEPSGPDWDPEAFAARVAAKMAELQPKHPDIHPFDLHTIVHAMLLPFDRRSFFLRRRPDGGYEF